MEATAQSTQRKITLESLDLVHARRPDIQIFSELLVQYRREGERRPGQVVPDNMVVLCNEPIKADGSYDVPMQPAKPFWVLEYVSKSSKRKDYEDNFLHYEKALQVPYYMIFYPETQDLQLYRHNGSRYVSVIPDANQRHAIPELELELALLEGWVRFWFRSELLPLPGDMQKELDELRISLQRERKRADIQTKRADDQEARAFEERKHAEQEKQRAEQEKQRAERQATRAEMEWARAEQEKARADEEARRSAQLEFTMQQDRAAMEKEIQELRARLAGQDWPSSS